MNDEINFSPLSVLETLRAERLNDLLSMPKGWDDGYGDVISKEASENTVTFLNDICNEEFLEKVAIFPTEEGGFLLEFLSPDATIFKGLSVEVEPDGKFYIDAYEVRDNVVHLDETVITYNVAEAVQHVLSRYKAVQDVSMINGPLLTSDTMMKPYGYVHVKILPNYASPSGNSNRYPNNVMTHIVNVDKSFNFVEEFNHITLHYTLCNNRVVAEVDEYVKDFF